MPEGKKIPKRKLSKWKASEKVRLHEVNAESFSIGCYTPKSLDQNVPKSLIKLMQLSESGKPTKRSYRRTGDQILEKADKRFKYDSVATKSHLRHLRNTAQAEAKAIHLKEEQEEKRVKHRKVAPDIMKITKKKNIFEQNRQFKKEQKKEKRKQKLKAARMGKVAVQSDSEDEMVDVTGFDEVKFGEVAHRPPKFSSVDKFVQRVKNRKKRNEALQMQ